jgi:hypothetical protein
MGTCGRHPPFEIAAFAQQNSPHHWKITKVHNGPRVAHGFPRTLYLRLNNETVQATSRSYIKIMRMNTFAA